MTDQTRRAVGVLTARVIPGLIFGMAGYWTTFELTPSVMRSDSSSFRTRNGHVIPRTLMLLVVAFTPREADWCSLDCCLRRRVAGAP